MNSQVLRFLALVFIQEREGRDSFVEQDNNHVSHSGSLFGNKSEGQLEPCRIQSNKHIGAVRQKPCNSTFHQFFIKICLILKASLYDKLKAHNEITL